MINKYKVKIDYQSVKNINRQFREKAKIFDMMLLLSYYEKYKLK